MVVGRTAQRATPRAARSLYGRQTGMRIDGRKVGDIVELLPLA